MKLSFEEKFDRWVEKGLLFSLVLISSGFYMACINGHKAVLINVYGKEAEAKVVSVQRHSDSRCPSRSIYCDVTGQGKVVTTTYRYVLKIDDHTVYTYLPDGIPMGSELSVIFVPSDNNTAHVSGYMSHDMYIKISIGLVLIVSGFWFMRRATVIA